MYMESLESLPKAATLIKPLVTLNVIIKDCAGNYHHAHYNDNEKTYKSLITGLYITDPVLWCRLPNVDYDLFESEMDRLYTN